MILIMPMAGLGSRFGEGAVKPEIDVMGVPMFVHSERCIGIDFEKRIFITRREHNLKPLVQMYYPDAIVLEINYTTEGTAQTLLLAKQYIKDNSVFVSNCDQHVEWDKDTSWQEHEGAIAVFDCPKRDPKWSYAQVDQDNRVVQVAEKNPISDWATVGWYYWRNGRHLLRSIEQMIDADDRVNNEFYTCPTYNYMKKEHKDIIVFEVDKMQGIGTPDDLETYKYNSTHDCTISR